MPFVTNKYKMHTATKVKSVDVDADDNLKIILSVLHKTPEGGTAVSEIPTTAKQILNHLKESDDRLRSSKYVKELKKIDQHEDAQYDLDKEGANKRDDLRKQLARQAKREAKEQKREARTNTSWRDRINIGLANIWTGNSKMLGEKGTPKRKLAVAVGAGVMAVAYFASAKGLMDSDNVNSLASAVGPEAAEAATPPAELTQTPTLEVAQAFRDSVDSGDGITHTIMDYAQSQGMDISPSKAYELYQNTPASLLNEIPNTSAQDVMGGVGFNGARQVTVPTEVIEQWNKQLGIK